MSVTRTGSVGSIQSTADTGSQSITVPADAQIIVVCIGGYHATASRFSGGTLTLNGVSLTVGRADDTDSAKGMSCIRYLVNPATGSQTLAWNWSGTGVQIIGAQIYYSFYKGLDISNPIRDSQGIQQTGSTSVARTVANTQPGDMICAYSHLEQNNPNYPTGIDWTNATEVVENIYNLSNNAYAENAGGADVTITATGTGGSGSTYYYDLSVITLRRGNNFTADSNCKALWKFENGALTTDSKGTNTLTNNNTVVADTVNFKEGAASADFESTSSQSMSITDANLNAGFPLKNGDTNKIISVCCWFRLESRPAADADFALYAKYDSTNTKRSILVTVQTPNPDTGSTIELRLGYNSGASLVEIFHGYSLSTATWYHLTLTYRDSDKSYTVRLKDTSGNTLGTDLATTWANNITVADAPFTIGAFNPTPTFYYDGLIDELVVFDDVITAAEATQIAQGTYGTTNLIPKFMYHYQHNIGSGV